MQDYDDACVRDKYDRLKKSMLVLFDSLTSLEHVLYLLIII